jgi:hypothetical protein
VCGRQFWLLLSSGLRISDRASSIAFWADTSPSCKLLASGVRLKTVPSRLTVAHLQRLLAEGARPAGPPPTPAARPHDLIEVDRLVNAQIGPISPRRTPAPHRLSLRLLTPDRAPSTTAYLNSCSGTVQCALRSLPVTQLTLLRASSASLAHPRSPDRPPDHHPNQQREPASRSRTSGQQPRR